MKPVGLLGLIHNGQRLRLQRYWHDNGQIKMEISSLTANFMDRAAIGFGMAP